MGKLKFFAAIFIFFAASYTVFSQVELVPLSNPVYGFLERMYTNKVIDNYSPTMGPVSRKETANLLLEITAKQNKLSKTDKALLKYYTVEFEYDMYGTMKNSSDFFSKKGVG